VAAVLAGVGVGAALSTRSSSWFFAALVGGFVALLLTKTLIVGRAIGAAQRQQWACFDKPRLIEAVEDGARSSCEIGEASIRWSGIREVVETVVVIVAGGGAYPVARTRVSSGGLHQFVELVRAKTGG
jgi:hypothetical protein